MILAGIDLEHLESAVETFAPHEEVSVVRGEFLSDLRYEDWASRLQMSMHTDVRRFLLPVAQAGPDTYETELSLRAAETLLRLDPFDEAAVLALASAMARSGKRVAARELVLDYASRVREEFEEEPSSQFVRAVGSLGASGKINALLTDSENNGFKGLTRGRGSPTVRARSSTLVLRLKSWDALIRPLNMGT